MTLTVFCFYSISARTAEMELLGRLHIYCRGGPICVYPLAAMKGTQIILYSRPTTGCLTNIKGIQ